MSQKTREKILKEVKSDHLPQMFEIELRNNTKSDKSSSAEASTQVKVVTWNILARCKEPNTRGFRLKFPSNNPWNYKESQENFNARLNAQAKQLRGYMEEGVGIFCLQECSKEAAEIIKNQLGNNFDFKTFESESLSKDKKGKESYTFYDTKKFNFKESNNTLFSENKTSSNKGMFLGLAITFRDSNSGQDFVVENVHGLFNEARLVIKNLEKLKREHSSIPVISVGDYNNDASKLNKQDGVKTFACNLATNFDADSVENRGESAEMETKNKCFDMAHVILPEGFSLDVKATYQYFTKNLEPLTKISDTKTIETIDGSGVLESSQADFPEVKDKKSEDSEKSTFLNPSIFNKRRFYDFINCQDDALKQVPVAITGSTNDNLFWQIGGAGMNGNLEKYLKDKKVNAFESANQKLANQKPKGKEDAIGKITQVDLGLTEDAQVQKILYSASPNLSDLSEVEAKKAMIAFGKKFRDQLNEQGIKELCLPLYSGGIYNGKNSQKQVAEWLMEGWFLAERENQSMKNVKVYLGHECLVDAVRKKTSTHFWKAEDPKILAGKKFVLKMDAPEDPDLKNSAKITSQKELEAKIVLNNIREKIFVNPEGGSENLSAEDVAIRKFVGNKKELVEEKRKKWSEKESGEKESVLEYAAKGVFNKALKAEENLKSSSRNTVKGEEWGQKDSEEWKKKSQEVWYDRFVRTDFKEVDLSETFRTVFVNCTFDENCVLPKEKSSIDPKYFSNCQFSKSLMNKGENKELKKALEEAGMIFDKDSGFYKIDNIKRKIYGEENSEETPDSSCKPIESFKLTPDFKSKVK